MLAGQLLAIAEDMIGDYDRLGILSAMEIGANLAAERPNLSEQQFHDRATDLRANAEKILSQTILRTYPIGLKRALNHSGYSQSLPDAIAKTLLAGFGKRRKDASISSAELMMLLNEARAFYQKMQNLVEIADSFDVEKYLAPEGQVALEIRIPDLVYGRSLKMLPKKIDHIEDALAVIEELVTGSRSPHKLLWASTTDLVIAIPLDWGVVLAVLIFYERLLVIAEKHLNVIKLLRDLRKMSGSKHDDVAAELQKTIDHGLEQAAKDIVKQLGEDREPGRKNELELELKTVSRALLPDLAAGMRFAVDPRDQQRIMLDGAEASDAEDLARQLDQRRELELKLDNQLGSFAEEEVKMLTSDSQESQRSERRK